MLLDKILKAARMDRDIHSEEMQRYVIYSSFGFHFFIFICDQIIDFDSISSTYLTIFILLSSMLSIANYKKYSVKVLGVLNLILYYFSLEGIFVDNPDIFYYLIYWYVFLIIIAAISGGMVYSIIWLAIVIVTIVFNYSYITNFQFHDESRFIVSVPVFKATLGTILFMGSITIFVCLFHVLLGRAFMEMKSKSEESQQLKNIAESKRRKLEKYQKAHFDLIGDKSIIGNNPDKLFQKICQLALESMEVSKVSIWTFNHDSHKFVRDILITEEQEIRDRATIDIRNFPKYYEAILSQKYIAATDAQTDVCTREFKEKYFKEQGVFSVLNSPFFVDGKLLGIICCENLHSYRQWNSADILFIQSLSEFISYSFKSQESQLRLKHIQEQNEKLLEQREEIEAMNEQLSNMNDSLEEMVIYRTKELESQNEVLKEYSFINSHQLRAPLSRIQGLSQLISFKLNDPAQAELVELLLQSTQELDCVISRISNLLYHGEPFYREDINKFQEDQ